MGGGGEKSGALQSGDICLLNSTSGPEGQQNFPGPSMETALKAVARHFGVLTSVVRCFQAHINSFLAN